MGSTAPNGSSISSTGGSAARARATPTRCCCPPRQLGRVALGQLGVEADELEQLVDPLADVRALSQPSSRGTVAMFWAIVRCGNSPTCWIT